jgi:hypothetical protein
MTDLKNPLRQEAASAARRTRKPSRRSGRHPLRLAARLDAAAVEDKDDEQ